MNWDCDLLAKQQINDLQIEVFAFYNKSDYEPVQTVCGSLSILDIIHCNRLGGA